MLSNALNTSNIDLMFQQFGIDIVSSRLPPLFLGSVRTTEKKILQKAFSRENSLHLLQKHQYQKKANTMQRKFHTVICEAVYKKTGQIFFLQGRGGVGKTFLINYIATTLRSNEKLVWCSATTGIAAINFQRGSTMDHLFKLGIDSAENENFVNNIRPGTDRFETILNLNLIIIDEISMCSGKTFSRISKILQEIRSSDLPFGGITMLVAGDMLQRPPVIINAFSAAAVVRYMVHKSAVWKHSVQPLVLSRQKTDIHFYNLLQQVAEGKTPSESNNFELPLVPASADPQECQ